MGNGRELSGGGLENGSSSKLARSVRTHALAQYLAGALAVLLLTAGARVQSASHRSWPAASLHLIPSVALKSSANLKPDAQALLANLPLIFEANEGQVNSGVQFVSRGPGYSLFLAPSGAILATPKPRSTHAHQPATKTADAVRMTLVGANRGAILTGSEPLAGNTNYFIGNDPKKWHTGIAHFAGVRYQNVYPGIDLVFYGNQGHLEYDFKVAPGANPAQAELQFDGASKIELSGGDLILKGTSAGVRLQAPHIYQTAAGRQQRVEGHFVLRSAKRVGFSIGAYDHSRELVIDPTINYSTYFGGSGAETTPSIAVNNDGYIYLAGSTTSTDLPVGAFTLSPGVTEGLVGAQNLFVLKLNPSLAALGAVYVTYLGGNGVDYLAGSASNSAAGAATGSSAGLAVDNGSNIYLGGTTTSTNFPTSNGYQTAPLAGSTGATHVFVSEISGIAGATATLNYSTYLSGNGTDVASAIAIDAKGDVFVTGTTTSTNTGAANPGTYFPSTSLPIPLQEAPSSGSTIQFFMTEVNTRLVGAVSIAYSTYFGGATTGSAGQAAANNIGGGIAVDTTGIVYFSGTTNMFNSGEGSNGTGGLAPGDFPILNAYQPCLDSPPPTTVVPPITCTAPTAPIYPTDAFVAKLNPASAQNQGAQLLFSTYLGGSDADSSTGLAVDIGASNVYITGVTSSPDYVLPTASGAFQECLDTPVNPTTLPCPTITQPAPTDAYVAKLTNPTEGAGGVATPLAFSYFSYLGGSANDEGLGIAVDTAGGALVTGWTQSGAIQVVNPAVDFPVTSTANFSPIQSSLNGPQNAFFARINTTAAAGSGSIASYATYFGGNGTDSGTSIAVDPSLNSYLAGQTTSTNLHLQGPLQPSLAGTMDAFAVKLTPTSLLCISCIPPVFSTGSTTSSGSPVIGAGNAITVTFTLTNEGPDLATNIGVLGTVTAGAAFSSGSPATAGSGTCSAATGLNVACTIPSLQSGSTSAIAFSVTPTIAGNYSLTAAVNDSGNIDTSVSYSVSFTATNYTMMVTPSSQSVFAGDVAPFSVQVTPSITYGNNVSLSCSNLPVGASCGFSPSTISFSNTGGVGAGSSLLNLTTTARPITTISSLHWRSPFYALWLMFPGIALAGAGKRKRAKWLGWLAAFTLFALVMLLPACSKQKEQPIVSGTPAGTYPITVTATSGTYTQSYGITLTVQ
jgi:Domain of unknown function DUF11/Beta-propeller repeat